MFDSMNYSKLLLFQFDIRVAAVQSRVRYSHATLMHHLFIYTIAHKKKTIMFIYEHIRVSALPTV